MIYCPHPLLPRFLILPIRLKCVDQMFGCLLERYDHRFLFFSYRVNIICDHLSDRLRPVSCFGERYIGKSAQTHFPPAVIFVPHEHPRLPTRVLDPKVQPSAIAKPARRLYTLDSTRREFVYSAQLTLFLKCVTEEFELAFLLLFLLLFLLFARIL